MTTKNTPNKPRSYYQSVVDDLPICDLTNTDDDTFWYVPAYKQDGDQEFTERYKHEVGKVGDRFFDGNNGDEWEVLAINTKRNRAVVCNLTQGGEKLVFWP